VREIYRVICLAPRDPPPSEPEEDTRKPPLDLENVADEPNKDVADMMRCAAFDNEPSLHVIRIAEKPNATPTDGNALAERREAEWPDPSSTLLR
jgi:hypothetical protein